MLLSAKEAIASILFGNALPFLLIAPIILLFARYGVDTFIGFRSALGYLGSNIFYFIFMFLTIGYMSVAFFMAGEALVKIASVAGLPEFFTNGITGAPFFAIIVFAIVFFITFQGPLVMRKFNLIGVPAILLVTLGLVALLMVGQGWEKIFSLPAPESYDDHARSMITALEINIGLGFSWLPYLGQYSRLAKSEKSAFKAGFFSYGIIVNVAVILGALAALVVASLDPTDWMFAIGGTWVGVIGLLLLTLGNITAGTFLMYSQAISFKTVFPKKSWTLAMGTAIPTVLLLLSASFYDAFGSFITVISYIMAIFGGIVISDFFFVKKQKVSIRDLYDTNGSYYYWKGINPSAIVSFIVGTIVYWSLYNPVLDTSSSLFYYMSAGIPAYFAAGICYYVSAKYLFSYEADRGVRTESIPSKSNDAV
ncbi:Cytosine/purine/uracil/thiamine/allantoin permease family protein [Bacillus thermotolerans]|nr:Cytosine/purine/uracil/thiamine/allantoin permease family protein [Bacillus thermotolerans]